MTLSARETDLLGWLASQYDAMVGLLGRLVDTDSGSYDIDGVARAGALIRDHLGVRRIPCEEIVQADGSASLKATVPPRAADADNAHVLLLGHRDTVFPRGTAAERPFRVEGERAYGPGVADMKAGLVMNAFVLEAFARLGGGSRPLVNLVTSDEEIASPASRPVIEAAGIKDILSKSYGSNNPVNVVKAAFQALSELTSLEEQARIGESSMRG